jgi:hypothetical protein
VRSGPRPPCSAPPLHRIAAHPERTSSSALSLAAAASL